MSVTLSSWLRGIKSVNKVIEMTCVEPQLINRNICFTESRLNQYNCIILIISDPVPWKRDDFIVLKMAALILRFQITLALLPITSTGGRNQWLQTSDIVRAF